MRQKVATQRRAMLTVVMVGLFLMGTGGTRSGCAKPEQEAQATARDFLVAAQEGNTDAAARTLTTKAREYTGTSMGWVRDEKQGHQGFTVGTGDVSGDTARVPVTFTDGDGTNDADLHLRREDGQWRVCGIELKSGVGPTLDVDFERPEDTIGSAFRTAGQALGQFARGMEQGAKEFEKGFEQSYKNGTPSKTGTVIVEVTTDETKP